MTAEEMIAKAGSILAREAGPNAKVILFGSHARGDARAGSGLDFSVIEPEVEGRHREMVRLRRLVRWHGAGLAIGQMTLGVTRRRVSRCGCRISSGEARRSSGFVTMQHARTNGKHGGGS